jgi:hypothetical protein
MNNKALILGTILSLGVILFAVIVVNTSKKTPDFYCITRTSSYPNQVITIDKSYKNIKNVQFVPIKGYSNIGIEYLCTIEMMDSTFLTYFTNEYVGNFHYESMRFFVWNVIEKSKDSTFSTISTIKASDIAHKNDTILYKGLKIYDIEKFTMEKFMEKFDEIQKVKMYEKEIYSGK